MFLFKNWKIFFYFLIFSLLIITLCTLRNHYFFTIDDSQNEYLGFMHQYGESWQRGEIPFITKNIIIGSNAMVELQRAIFAPHNIIGSLLNAYSHHILATGLFFALLDLLIICFSGYIIGKCLDIKDNLAIVLGLFLAINPMYLYQYAGPWWNAANGHAISLLSIASILYLIKKQTTTAYIFNFISVLWLLLSGWPHGFIGYLIIALCFIICTNKTDKKNIFCLFMPTLCAGMCAIPIYSEFIYLKNLINRSNGWSNFNNALVPSLSQMLLTFSPSYYDYMNYVGKYRPVFFPIGFSTIFFIFSCCYLKINFNDKMVKILISLSIIFLILCQMPTQTGMLRYTFRFLPFFSFIITIFTFYTIEKSEIIITKPRQKLFYIFITTTLIISVSTCFFELHKVIIANIITFILLLFIYVTLFKNKSIRKASILHLSSVPFMCFLIILFVLPSVGDKYMYQLYLPNNLQNLKDLNLSGYTVSFKTLTKDTPQELNDINSSQFGYYDIKSLNGYSPNAHIYIDQMLHYPGAHTIFKQEIVLPNLLTHIPELNNVCMINLFNISTIILHEGANLELIKQCGFTKFRLGSHNYTYAMYNKELPSTLSYSSVSKTTVTKETNNKIQLNIPNSSQENTLIFSREFWPGYTASGLACNVKLSGFKYALLSAQIPPHCSGDLTISYFPKTWKYALFCPVFGIISFIIFLIYINKRRAIKINSLS